MEPAWKPPAAVATAAASGEEEFLLPTLDFLMPPKRNENPGMSKAALNETARQLDMQRSHLYKKIEKYGLSREETARST